MRLEWMNEERTILFVETGEVDLVLEPGHPDWLEYSLREDIAPYTAPWQPTPLSIWRSSASLTKSEFCLALKRMKILSVAEAKAASKGEWPPSFADALANLPTLGIDPDEAEILWGSVTVIERMHPLFLALKEKANVTDEQADAMFGWTG